MQHSIAQDCLKVHFQELDPISVEALFRKIVLNAGYTSIGIKTIGTHNVSIMNVEIERELQRRDELLEYDQIDWEAVTEVEKESKRLC